MSLLTPERVPVKVYRWDDVGAPALDKTANCVATIFKACLVTGYGDKEGAGWTMPFEDTTAGIKVLRPEVGTHTDFYLRLSADTGKEMAAQVYLNMIDVNTGDLKLQCDTSFKYAKATSSGKWLLVASSRGIWFFCEHNKGDLVSKTGSHFFAGDTGRTDVGQRLVYLHHTGGTGPNFVYASVTGLFSAAINTGNAQTYIFGSALLPAGATAKSPALCLPDGGVGISDDTSVMPIVTSAGGKVCLLPGAYIPFNGATKNNFDNVSTITDAAASNAIVFGTSNWTNSNMYIASDFWSY